MLAKVMRALANAPCQVILVSTIPPAGKVARKVWTVVDLKDRGTGTGGGGDHGGNGGSSDDGDGSDGSTAEDD
jgi:uncharacterized membrane protein YgcG